MFSFAEKEFNLGKSSILSEPMFCVCGFSAHSGNKLAKHLGTHGCKSAYPSQEEADKAKVEKGGKRQAKFRKPSTYLCTPAKFSLLLL